MVYISKHQLESGFHCEKLSTGYCCLQLCLSEGETLIIATQLKQARNPGGEKGMNSP